MAFHSVVDRLLHMGNPGGVVSSLWKVLEETSPSGKRLFVCTSCGRISYTPDKFCPPPCPAENKMAREAAMRRLKEYRRIGRGA